MRKPDILRNHQGSGIITVMVAVSFVAILGALLLYSAYTGFQVKVTERESKANFYDAETVMNEIRAGVQAKVSESLSAAYTDVLVNYGTYADEDAAQRALYDNFVKELKLRGLYNNAGQLNQTTLASFIEHGTGVTLSVPDKDAFGHDIVSFVQNASGNTATLKGIKVSMVDNGYASTVESDLLIRVPLFNFAGRVDISTNDLSGLVSVAKAGIAASTSNGTIHGNVYGGSLTAEQGKLTVQSGLLVIKGDVKVSRGDNLTVGSDATLWAKDIIIGENGAATLSGAVYVANDLNLAGKRASVKLEGQYYGFGNSVTKATESSAILVNGAETKLELQNLKRLMLGGRSFISVGTGETTADVLMGESVSIKSNQLAYLVPASELGDTVTANPYICGPFANAASITLPTDVPDRVTVNYLDGEEVKTTDIKVKTLIKTLPGDNQYRVCYYFFDFTGEETIAEQHFAYYFQENNADITKYIQKYSVGMDSVREADSYGTAGSTMYLEGTGASAAAKLVAAKNVYALSSGSMRTQYANLCQDMNPNFGLDNITDPDYSPFSFFVSEAALTDNALLTQMELKDDVYKFWPEDTDASDKDDAHVSAIFAPRDFSDFARYPNARLVLCQGDVTLGSNFSGLIFCQGTLTINNGAVLSYTSVSEINKAMMAKNHTLRFDDFMRVKGDSVDAASGGGSTWDLDYLVGYTNWGKNPE